MAQDAGESGDGAPAPSCTGTCDAGSDSSPPANDGAANDAAAEASAPLGPTPTHLTATAVSSSEIDLSWTAAAGAVTGYQIWRGVDPNGLMALVATTTNSKTTYHDTPIAPSTQWTYQVAAIVGGKPTKKSNAASATTPAVPPRGGMPTFACPPGAITVDPSEDIHAIVANAPAGSTFCFKPGTYRAADPSSANLIEPLPGDTFLGGPGVVLSGSVVITTWTSGGSPTYYQSHSGLPLIDVPQYQTQNCPQGNPLCGQMNDLYFDNTPLTPVASLSALQSAGAGHWYFDTTNGIAYVMQDPSGHTVELSVQQSAIDGDNGNPQNGGQSGIPNLTVKGFVVEKFANPDQFAALGHQVWQAANCSGWDFEYDETRLNHYKGIGAGINAVLQYNYSHDNGNVGMSCATGCTAINNESSHNGYAGYATGFEAGGSKNVASSSKWEGNYLHDNYNAFFIQNGSYAGSDTQGAPGLWFDVASSDNSIQNNNISNNTGAGLEYEISCNATISNNLFLDNGDGAANWVICSGITLFNSEGSTISGNIVRISSKSPAQDNCNAGIAELEQSRCTPAGTCAAGSAWSGYTCPSGQIPIHAENNTVQNNVVELTSSTGQCAAAAIGNGSGSQGAGNTWSGNAYWGLSYVPGYNQFWIDSTTVVSTGWQAAGLDTQGVFNQGSVP
ncbi:MAG TPA: fibronectin type III domain-containing protein [Polyangiaceae bacterium]